MLLVRRRSGRSAAVAYFYGAISNTVPSPYSPPAEVVPYKFPAASKITPAVGYCPSLPRAKLLSNVSVQIPSAPGLNLNTVPHPPEQRVLWPPSSVVL